MQITINVDSKYHREQFDDWLAGGSIEYNGKTLYWSALDSNYGYGWEIEPISEEKWNIIPEERYKQIIEIIEKCLTKHKTEYSIN